MNKIGSTFEELDLTTMNTIQGNGISGNTITITISYCPIITPITVPITVPVTVPITTTTISK